MLAQVISASLYGIGAFLSAFLALRLATRRLGGTADQGGEGSDLVFLIRDGKVGDANFPARRLLDRTLGPENDFDSLRLILARDFDEADALTAPADDQPEIGAQSRDGRLQVSRQIAGDSVRLRITAVTGTEPRGDDIHTLRAMANELETLRANTSAAPFLLWRQNESGEITWANRAYLDAVRAACPPGSDRIWPLPTLFPAIRFSDPRTTDPHRISIQDRVGSREAWYDCHVASVGPDMLCTAIPADEAVRSENRRREFTQTLTKTFAELAIGLAIFDKKRRLVLFNPALLDLTNLPTDFLTARPSLVSFLDHLRENRVMPEPRDYRAWRASIAELEAAAVDGTYSETWSLPDGQTYHVTGRPHPDGAVALLFEDISAEMSLTRRFRAELAQAHAVIDAFDDAVATFSAAGRLTLSNRAYRELWQTDPDAGLVGIDITEATRHWHARSNPTPVWGDFHDFAQRTHDREEWTATVTLTDGRAVYCRFIPQKAGMTMAIFRLQTAVPVAARSELRKAV